MFHVAIRFKKTNWVTSLPHLLFKTYFNISHLERNSLVWEVHRIKFFLYLISFYFWAFISCHPALFMLYFHNSKLQARWAILHLCASARAASSAVCHPWKPSTSAIKAWLNWLSCQTPFSPKQNWSLSPLSVFPCTSI